MLFFGMLSFGQQIDSLNTPELPEPQLQLNKKEKAEWPVPKKAILFSIVPGGGQIYNKRWWKVPVVYGFMAGGVWAINRNRGFYLRFNEALNLSRQGLPHEFTELGLTTTTLKIRRDLANKYMQQSYLATVVFYLLQGTEAFVDAHLRNFDLDEDLSFKVSPSLEYIPQSNQPVVGMTIAIPISR
ncbi:MAG: hypothetical protein DWQ02_06815 [Bacteroidetes bacterium]|nr:MAG: hypothetical protein DWQ02_06815 [Bacteroidota bacterium]